jgi:MoxR-like ATPase
LPESGKVIEADEENMPAIVITSNREQELPTAFKGRCIYHYIAFPDVDLMRNIVLKHYPSINDELLQNSLRIFYQLRDMRLERSPATRELLNWLKYLRTFDLDEAQGKMENLSSIGVLIKTKMDLDKVKRKF